MFGLARVPWQQCLALWLLATFLYFPTRSSALRDRVHSRAQHMPGELLESEDEGGALADYATQAVQQYQPAENVGPQNISGTYRGSWRTPAQGPSWFQLPMLRNNEGNIVYQLRSIPGPEGMVHNVQGEIVLRDGHSITDRDVRMHLDGFYVAATGRLHGVLEPQVPVRVPFESHMPHGQGGPPDYREALRAVARQWAVLGNPNAPELLNAAEGILLLRECKFRLELNVRRAQRRQKAAASTAASQLQGTATTPTAEGAAGASEGGLFGAVFGQAASALGDPGQLGVSSGPRLQGALGAEGKGARLLQQALLAQQKEGGSGVLVGQLAAQQQQQQQAQQQLQQRLRLRVRQQGQQEWEVVQEVQGPGEQDPPHHQRHPNVFMDGAIISDNCNASWALNASTIHLERYYAKAVRYSLAITALTFAQILLLVLQMEASATPAAASRVSLLCISQLSLMDAYLCLLHLTAALVLEALFNAFALAAFFQFVVFAVFEMRLLLLVWRAQRPWLSDAWAARRELSLLYSRFYGVLLGGIFLAYHLQHHVVLLLFAAYSFWVPQIAHSAIYDARTPLRPCFIIGMSTTRLLLPLYLFGCPHNVLRVAPRPLLCGALVAWVVLQAALLLLQHARGPRCLVPRRWLPLKYDYFRKAAPKDASSSCGPACVSCAEDVAVVECCTGSSSSGSDGSSSGSGGMGSRAASRLSCCGSSSGSSSRASISGRCCAFGCGGGEIGDDMECGGSSSSSSRSGCEAQGCYGGPCCIECVICMSPVDVVNHHARMVTPCGHFFHESCLLRWMDVKMECPTCRRALPPL